MGESCAKGNLAEAAVLADLLRLGYSPMVPWGGNARYDLGVDIDGALIRLQCKTAWQNGPTSIRFKARSNSGWHGANQRGYAGDADHFAVYLPATAQVLYVPVADVPAAQVVLHFESTHFRARRVDQYLKPAF